LKYILTTVNGLINHTIPITSNILNMQIIFELNTVEGIKIEKEKILMKRVNFPIKVMLVDKKGRQKERLIFIRDKHEIPKIQLS
jgi:hypothetical protein